MPCQQIGPATFTSMQTGWRICTSCARSAEYPLGSSTSVSRLTRTDRHVEPFGLRHWEMPRMSGYNTKAKMSAFYDVCVIGGGPAGATLALRLPQLGRKVA